jgi:hypothetical protein
VGDAQHASGFRKNCRAITARLPHLEEKRYFSLPVDGISALLFPTTSTDTSSNDDRHELGIQLLVQ